jgi:hypothetical protein
VSSKRDGRYEFCSPTFRRLDADSAPAAAAAADTSSTPAVAAAAAAIDTSIQVQQQHTQASSPLLQVVAQTERPPAPNPTPTQADANAAITALLSNIQRQCSNQQPSIPSQQSVLSQLNTNLIRQSFQQWQHPDPTINLLNAALSILVGGQTPSAQLMRYSPVSQQRDAIQVLTTLYRMSSHAGAFPDTNTTLDVSQPNNNMAVQSLLTLLHQVGEDKRQRRANADAIRNATIATIGQILGVNNMDPAAPTAQGQVLRRNDGATSLNVHVPPRNPTGMTIRVPHHIAAQTHQGIPPPSAGSLNFHADPIAAILQAARGEAGQLLKGDAQTQNGQDNLSDNDDNDEGKDDHDERPLCPRKRKSPDR